MKCIRTMEGKIYRVKDDEARLIVSTGRASFAPKKEWKEKGRLYLGAKK